MIVLVSVGSFSGNLVETEKQQLSTMDRNMCVLRFAGRIVTLRGYKQASSRKVRTTTKCEFDEAIEELRSQGYTCPENTCPEKSNKQRTTLESNPRTHEYPHLSAKKML